MTSHKEINMENWPDMSTQDDFRTDADLFKQEEELRREKFKQGYDAAAKEMHGVRGEVLVFASHMEKMLQKHDDQKGKRGWKDDSIRGLEERLHQELAEYMETNGWQNKRREIIDVANFCMMIWDRWGDVGAESMAKDPAIEADLTYGMPVEVPPNFNAQIDDIMDNFNFAKVREFMLDNELNWKRDNGMPYIPEESILRGSVRKTLKALVERPDCEFISSGGFTASKRHGSLSLAFELVRWDADNES